MKIKLKPQTHRVLIFALGAMLFGGIPIFAIAGQWSSSGNTIYYTDGNVGIGTTTPGNNLDVKGSLSVYQNVSPYANYNPGLDSVVSVGASPNKIGLFVNGSASGGKAAEILLGSYEPTSTVFYAHSQNVGSDLILKGDGKVGIGTPDPKRRLHIKGNGGLVNIEGSDHAYIQWYPDGYSAGRKAWLGYANAVDNWITLSSEGAGGIQLKPGSHYVAVDGTLKAKQIQVKSNIWADYVFDDNYELMTLDDVEEFISKNRHLPNIPSAKEIENGELDLGEMQRLQMEKIEELTLYLIEKDKQIEVLHNKLIELERRIK